jgi:ubiquinone/menaquinone biosynthesis C-methylase UbiE
MTEALFDSVAKFYDYENETFVKDIPFYTSYAEKCRGEVLELACGTGRILIPIAQEGIKITGLDASHEMLNIARKKIEGLDEKSKRNIELIHGDMKQFNLDKTFSLIIIAFRSFQCLVRKEEQESCLKLVHQHLDDKGTLILDLFAPRHDLLAQVKRNIYLGKLRDRENDIYITRRAEDEYNLANQTLKEDRFYEWTDKQGIFHRHIWSF